MLERSSIEGKGDWCNEGFEVLRKCGLLQAITKKKGKQAKASKVEGTERSKGTGDARLVGAMG